MDYCKEKNVSLPLYSYRVGPKNDLNIEVKLPLSTPNFVKEKLKTYSGEQIMSLFNIKFNPQFMEKIDVKAKVDDKMD